MKMKFPYQRANKIRKEAAESELSFLMLVGNQMFIDDKLLKGVSEFELKKSSPAYGELSIKMFVHIMD